MSHRFHVANKITHSIIGCSYEVHSELGPGLLESVYEVCLEYHLNKIGFKVNRQVPIPLVYHEVKLKAGFRADLIVNDIVIVEIKSIDNIAPIHQAQLLTYMRLAKKDVGLLLNFNVPRMKDGINRFVI